MTMNMDGEINIYKEIVSELNAMELKQEMYIENVPIISQTPELPTGCEATSLTMLLNYYGNNISKFEVADLMPKGKKPYWYNNQLYGSDPNKEFVGSPYDPNSYGIFKDPILGMIDELFPGRGLDLTVYLHFGYLLQL